MAQVQFGALVTDIKGKIGGTTFKGNYSAASMQNIVKPFRKSTVFNQVQKSRLANVAGTWKTLTEEEKTAWNAIALTWPFVNCFGETYNGSGFMVYCQVNLNLIS